MAEMKSELAFDDTVRFTPTWHAGSNPFTMRIEAVRGLPVVSRSTIFGLIAGEQTLSVRVQLYHGVDQLGGDLARETRPVSLVLDKEWKEGAVKDDGLSEAMAGGKSGSGSAAVAARGGASSAAGGGGKRGESFGDDDDHEALVTGTDDTLPVPVGEGS